MFTTDSQLDFGSQHRVDAFQFLKDLLFDRSQLSTFFEIEPCERAAAVGPNALRSSATRGRSQFLKTCETVGAGQPGDLAKWSLSTSYRPHFLLY